MITNPGVFDRDHVPDLVCRDEELTMLENALQPVTYGDPAKDVLVHGPMGVGKTVTSKFMLDQLRASDADFDSRYVSCLDHDGEHRELLKSVVDPMVSNTTPIDSFSKSKLRDELRDAIDRPYLVVVDEADSLVGDAKFFLYDLYETSQLSVVLVANSQTEFLASLRDHPKIYDRFKRPLSVHFDRYDECELAQITQQRVRAGLRQSAVGDGVVETIAIVASNARDAIQILQSAATRVGDYGKLERRDVVEAVPEAREILLERALSRLGDHPNVLFDILDERGPLKFGPLKAAYEDRVENPRTRSSVNRYLSKLREYECVDYDEDAERYRARVVPGAVPDLPVV
jgi:Cdc6-like AAA superfamily ATPase